MRILLAEDDPRLAEPLREFLIREQHAVTCVADGRVALAELLQTPYDLAFASVIVAWEKCPFGCRIFGDTICFFGIVSSWSLQCRRHEACNC